MTSITRAIVAASLFCLASHSGSVALGDLSKAPAGASTLVQPSQLDTLLAPIALYPDALVLQILDCSAKPDDIKKLYDWLKKNPDVKGTAVQDAAAAQGFAASFVAIAMFPQVVQMMADKPDWTQSVGKAFADNRAGVFESIQRLRLQAQSVGNLASNEQQQVETVKTESGTNVIVIQPANPQVVYVPQYNPTVVYTQPPPPPSSGNAAAAGLVGFTAGVIIGAAIADNNDYWGYHGHALCNEGYDDYTEHRENMSQQRGENQSNRQTSRTENQSGRQDSQSQNQASRQDSRGSGGGSASGQSAQGQQAARGATNEARGSGTASTTAQRSGTNSGAMSGYQNGSAERQASSRGRTSTSSQSSGASRGGGSSRSGGGSRGGGGGGRGR